MNEIENDAKRIYETLKTDEKLYLQNKDIEDNLYHLPYNINGYDISIKKELIKIAHNDKTDYFELSLKEDEMHEKEMEEHRKKHNEHSTSDSGWEEMHESEYRD